MEGLRLVKAVAVRSPVLVSVQVLLGLPGVTIPELTVAFVAARMVVGALSNLQLGGVLKDADIVARPKVRFVVLLGAEVARPGRGHRIVIRLVVSSCVEHGAGTKATASDLHRDILFRNQRGIETSSSEVVRGLVDNILPEHIA